MEHYKIFSLGRLDINKYNYFVLSLVIFSLVSLQCVFVIYYDSGYKTGIVIFLSFFLVFAVWFFVRSMYRKSEIIYHISHSKEENKAILSELINKKQMKLKDIQESSDLEYTYFTICKGRKTYELTFYICEKVIAFNVRNKYDQGNFDFRRNQIEKEISKFIEEYKSDSKIELQVNNYELKETNIYKLG